MDVKTATIQVLQQAGTALHSKDIAEKIMAAGLWQSRGKTTDATGTIYNPSHQNRSRLENLPGPWPRDERCFHRCQSIAAIPAVQGVRGVVYQKKTKWI